MKDHRGTIIRMYSGTIRNFTLRANELWPMLIGSQGAFFEQENRVELETDIPKALKEWKDWRWFINPNHLRVIQQLEQRKKDPNLTLNVKVVTVNENRISCYLDEDGARNKTGLVIFRRLFGRVREI